MAKANESMPESTALNVIDYPGIPTLVRQVKGDHVLYTYADEHPFSPHEGTYIADQSPLARAGAVVKAVGEFILGSSNER